MFDEEKAKCPYCAGVNTFLEEISGIGGSHAMTGKYRCLQCGHSFEVYKPMQRIREDHKEHVIPEFRSEKGATTMQVSYNGFNGELVKLERVGPLYGDYFYNLSIYDSEKQATHSFTGMNLEDVKFLGGTVSFE